MNTVIYFVLNLSLRALETSSGEEPRMDLRQFLNMNHVDVFGDELGEAHVVYNGSAPIVAGMTSLTSLGVVESLLSEIPLRVFMNLTRLCIQGFSQDIALVLTHVPALKCLELRNQHSDIFDVLTGTVDRLIHLSSLALDFYDYGFLELDVLAGVSCLIPLTSLTRLQLALPVWLTRAEQLVSQLLPQLCSHLTAFGLEFTFVEDPSTFATIADILPHSLVALSLTLPWMTHSLDADAFLPLVST
jgi:hypothetical protein